MRRLGLVEHECPSLVLISPLVDLDHVRRQCPTVLGDHASQNADEASFPLPLALSSALVDRPKSDCVISSRDSAARICNNGSARMVPAVIRRRVVRHLAGA